MHFQVRDFDFRKRDQIAKVAAKPPGSAEEGDLPNSGAKFRRIRRGATLLSKGDFHAIYYT